MYLPQQAIIGCLPARQEKNHETDFLVRVDGTKDRTHADATKEAASVTPKDEEDSEDSSARSYFRTFPGEDA